MVVPSFRVQDDFVFGSTSVVDRSELSCIRPWWDTEGSGASWCADVKLHRYGTRSSTERTLRAGTVTYTRLSGDDVLGDCSFPGNVTTMIHFTTE